MCFLVDVDRLAVRLGVQHTALAGAYFVLGLSGIASAVWRYRHRHHRPTINQLWMLFFMITEVFLHYV